MQGLKLHKLSLSIQAAKKGWDKRIISIFEPHLYSRTKNFHKQFAKALSLSDHIIISDIYGAREKSIKGVSSELIIDDLHKMNSNQCVYIKDKNEIPQYINKIIRKNERCDRPSGNATGGVSGIF